MTVLLSALCPPDAKPATAGRLTGQDISLTTDRPDPANPTASLRSRLTPERWEKYLRGVVNSVVFCSSGQDLTPPVAARLTEPLLLGLTA